MSTRVRPERVYVSTVNHAFGRESGALVNEVRTRKWTCGQQHLSHEAALACAEVMRRRWVRDGRAER